MYIFTVDFETLSLILGTFGAIIAGIIKLFKAYIDKEKEESREKKNLESEIEHMKIIIEKILEKNTRKYEKSLPVIPVEEKKGD